MKRIIQLAAFACLSSVAFASTPDGETPAEETYCDDQSGAAFGICNAYCEAMDCGDENQRASDRACQQKERQYERITGEPMPECGAPPPPPPEPPTCEEECDTRYLADIAFCDASEPPPPPESKSEVRDEADPQECYDFAKTAWAECLFECDGGEECVPNFSGVCILPDFETERIASEVADSCACAELGGRWEQEVRRR